MSTSPDASSLTKGLLDDELIDLEPSIELELAHAPNRGPAFGVGLVRGSFASLSREIHSLRRRRLGSAALFLAAVFAVLFFWSFFAKATDHWLVTLMLFLRFAIAAACAGLIVSRISLAPSQILWVEYVLFGSFTIIIVVTQYQVNLDYLRQDDILGVISHMKNGVMGMFALMVVYGMFIPNDPRSTARVVLTMALAMLAGMVLLLERQDIALAVEQLHTSEHAGSNVIFLMIGAAMAIYGTLRFERSAASELHEAKKFGQYQIREKIGVGGMGEVYLAEHQMLKRPCALKLIRPEAGADPIALARFEREVQAAARLSHPNTIEIYDYGHIDDGTVYYVMEYLPGISLQDLVTRYGALSAGRAIYLFRQVCAGLAEAHSLGLVHRDLKPANIFVAVRGGESDVAKVLDFGLVKLTNDDSGVELTSDHRVSGTPLYMAPEQATGDRSLDARADIYALGCMLYFTLTGQTPFTGATGFEVMMAHARDPVVPPTQIRAEVPADLERVVLRCLAKRADGRYPDVKALGHALAACAAATDWDADKAQEWWAAVSQTATTPA